MKKIATLVGSVALLAAAVLPVVAAGNNCSNGTTGPFAANYCTVTNTSSTSVTNTNSANITNNVSARSTTGNNSASYSTLGGTVKTGNATTNATLSTVANINTTTVTGGPAASGNTGVNDVTGPDSDNRVTITNRQTVAVSNVNTANVSNEVEAESETGGNNADYNTGPSDVETGTARVSSSVVNHINDSATGINTGAGGTGGNTGVNGTTGPFSLDYVTIDNAASAAVANVNSLNLANRIIAGSETGDNSASYNTLGGDITSGNASTGVGVNNEGNINTTTIQMSMGGFANTCGSEVTGPFSDNRCNLLNSIATSVTNPNSSNVSNYDEDESNTGDNASDYNTGGGVVTSGIADVVKSILEHLNDTLTTIQ